MKKKQGKRHSAEQIIRKLREADTMLAVGKTIGQVVQVLEVSEQTFHRWRNQYGGMKAEEATVTIQIKVIDSCPEFIEVTDDCPLPDNFATLWQDLYPARKSAGFLRTRMRVFGGVAPTSPGDWKGLYIKEFMEVHTVDPGTGTADDFDGGHTPAKFCTPSNEGFVVGYGNFTVLVSVNSGECLGTETVDSFYDDHGKARPIKVLKGDAEVSETVICEQRFECGGTRLKVGENDRFKITRTFTNVDWTPPTLDDVVTQVEIAKVADGAN